MKPVIYVAVLLVPIVGAQGQMYTVRTGAMEPTLLIGDHIWVENPKTYLRGDIIVCRFSKDPNVTVPKRLIGLPGDRLRILNKVLMLNSHPVNESYAIYRGPASIADDFYYFRNFPNGAERQSSSIPISSAGREMLRKYVRNGELVVPDGTYFVLEDNRDYSLDSRMQGLVPASMMVGVVRQIISSDDPNTKQLRPGRQKISMPQGGLQ